MGGALAPAGLTRQRKAIVSQTGQTRTSGKQSPAGDYRSLWRDLQGMQSMIRSPARWKGTDTSRKHRRARRTKRKGRERKMIGPSTKRKMERVSRNRGRQKDVAAGPTHLFFDEQVREKGKTTLTRRQQSWNRKRKKKSRKRRMIQTATQARKPRPQSSQSNRTHRRVERKILK